MNRTLLALVLALGVPLILLQSFSIHQVGVLEAAFVTQHVEMQTLTHGPWMSGGIPVTVVTPALEGETPEAHSARHRALVKATLADFPMDPA